MRRTWSRPRVALLFLNVSHHRAVGVESVLQYVDTERVPTEQSGPVVARFDGEGGRARDALVEERTHGVELGPVARGRAEARGRPKRRERGPVQRVPARIEGGEPAVHTRC